MFIALVVVTVLLAALCLNSAAMKLRQNEQVLAVIHGTVGVPKQYLPVLAALEIAGTGGILLGLWLEPLGVLAAAGLVAYFAGAVGGHLRVRDPPSSCRCRRSCWPSPCSCCASPPPDPPATRAQLLALTARPRPTTPQSNRQERPTMKVFA